MANREDIGKAYGQTSMRLREVALRAGVRTSSIRYYESIGVLPEPEREGGQRRYGPEVLRLLAMIEAAQRAGLSLGEIRELRSVEDVADEIGQTVANTSHHLRALARAGLLATRREGTRIFYRLASDRVGELWSALRDVAVDHVAGLDRLSGAYLGDREGIEVIDGVELADRLERHEVVVLDVRPTPEFAAGHIAGARNVPIAELHERRQRLPVDREIVAYCRGPYCVYADDAVRFLSSRGHRARRLVDGFPEWKRAGLPVADGEAIAV